MNKTGLIIAAGLASIAMLANTATARAEATQEPGVRGSTIPALRICWAAMDTSSRHFRPTTTSLAAINLSAVTGLTDICRVLA